MDVRADIDRIETSLRAHGVSVAALMRAAEVNNTLWTRWKKGTPARQRSWDRVIKALPRLLPAYTQGDDLAKTTDRPVLADRAT